MRVIANCNMSSFRPKLELSQFSNLFGYSKWLLIQNIFSGFNQRMPVLIIGRYLSAQAVAYYNISLDLVLLASNELAAPIRSALFPGVAKMDGDKEKSAQAVVATLGIIVLVGLPATIGIGVTAPLIVPIFARAELG